MYNIAGKMRHRVDVYAREKYTDEAGSLNYRYRKVKRIWCSITPIIGERARNIKTDKKGDMTYSGTTLRFVTRINALEVQQDMYLVYKGQRYDIDYAVPYFKDMQYMEIYARLYVENDSNILTRDELGF